VTPKNKSNQVSKAAEPLTNTRQQCVENIDSAINNNIMHNDNVFNIQLNYNINQVLDPKSWDGNFWVILFHNPIEHLASNIKNIKESLIRIHKYILGKSIEGNKAN